MTLFVHLKLQKAMCVSTLTLMVIKMEDCLLNEWHLQHICVILNIFNMLLNTMLSEEDGFISALTVC